ncbi:MAG: glycosyltransferase [Cytophagaceae bacterium]
MKRILFTVTNDLTYDQRMHRICSTLSEAGFQVTLIGRKRRSSVPLTDKSYLQKRLACIFQKGKLFYLEFNIRLLFHLLFKKADIMCAIDLDTIIPVYIVTKIRRTVMVYDAHELFTEVPEVIRRPAVRRIWLQVEKIIVPKLKYAYTVSENLQRIFSERYSVRFGLIRNVPVRKNYVVNNEKAERYIIYSGAVNEGRGIEYLLDVMAETDCRLVIAGDGDILENMKALAREKGIEDKVEFRGYVQPGDLQKLISEAYIGVNLLENKGLSYYYSLANKFFDYIQAGIPQLTVDFPEYAAINKRYQVAHLVPMKIEEIKNGLRKLLDDRDYYDHLVRNCKAAAEEYNWEREKITLVNFYKQIE